MGISLIGCQSLILVITASIVKNVVSLQLTAANIVKLTLKVIIIPVNLFMKNFKKGFITN